MIRAIDKWFPGYLRHAWRVRGLLDAAPRPLHLVFCVCDHFEPFQGNASKKEALRRIGRWVDEYPKLFSEFRDADGKPPQHTFFYPAEEYDRDCLNLLAELCSAGFGEVEIHLHHRNDTPAGFREKLLDFKKRLHDEHGLLGTDRAGTIRYGFIHGNWALCNSRLDGDWCGVNEELGILAETGCYADFTFPSAPSPTQSRMVNAIYYARDTPGRPRGHDWGTEVRSQKSEVRGQESEVRSQESEVRSQESEVRSQESGGRGAGGRGGGEHRTSAFASTSRESGLRRDRSNIEHPPSRGSFGGTGRTPNGGGGEPRATDPSSNSDPHSAFRTPHSALKQRELLMIQGPLALNWRRRKWGILPRLENAELSAANPPTLERAELWVRQHVHVLGRPEWVFVKLHTHGCRADNMNVLLGSAMRKFHEGLGRRFGNGKMWQIHYMSSRETHNLARAAEAGLSGGVGAHRNSEIVRPVA